MDERGYDCQWRVFNSKDYGVPQNRERVYIVGRLRTRGRREILFDRRTVGKAILQIGNIHEDQRLNYKNPQTGRIYDSNGLAPTLTTCQGGGLVPKFVEKHKLEDSTDKNTGVIIVGQYGGSRQRGRVFHDKGIAPTLMATDHKGPPLTTVKSPFPVKIINNTKKGYLEAYKGDGVDLSYVDQNQKRGRVQPQRTNTLTTTSKVGVILGDEVVRIRRLTPRECWRLQGFTDEQFDKVVNHLSDTQLYKQAGNSVTVNVVETIGKSILNAKEVKDE